MLGTSLFGEVALGFVHQMPMVYLVVALVCLSTASLDHARQPLFALFLSLSAVAYLSGLMYLVAVTTTVLLLRILSSERSGLPSFASMTTVWLAAALIVGLCIAFTDRSFLLAEAGRNHRDMPLVMPFDERFWAFFLTTLAKGYGLPTFPAWGAGVLISMITPFVLLAHRLWRSENGLAASEVFVLGAPVAGALAALAMISSGRALLAGQDPASIAANAARHDYYFLHATFALPFSAVAWCRALGRTLTVTVPTLCVVAAHLAGFAWGADGSLIDRLNYRAVFEAYAAGMRPGAICLENKVRLMHATSDDVPIVCPSVFPRDLRQMIIRAEKAGVASVRAITAEPSLAPQQINAAISDAHGAPIGSAEIIETTGSYDRITGAAVANDRSADWVAATRPGDTPWLVRVGELDHQPGGFEILLPRRRTTNPVDISLWAIFLRADGSVGKALPIPLRSHQSG